jgi:hypothetical protein
MVNAELVRIFSRYRTGLLPFFLWNQVYNAGIEKNLCQKVGRTIVERTLCENPLRWRRRRRFTTQGNRVKWTQNSK